MSVVNCAALLREFTAKVGAPSNNDNAKRDFVAAFAKFCNGRLNTTRFGGKAREGLGEASKATLGYWLGTPVPDKPSDGHMDVFQIVSSSGEVGWDLRAEHEDPLYHFVFGRFFPVSAMSPTSPLEPVDPPKPKISYAQMLAMVSKSREAYLAGSFGKTQEDIPYLTAAHLIWRFLMEGYSEEKLIEDAKSRGNDVVPD